jgi:hypothetical protein
MACSRGCWLEAQVVARFGACMLRMRSPTSGASAIVVSVGSALVAETFAVGFRGVGSLAWRGFSFRRGKVEEYARTKRGRTDANVTSLRPQDIILGKFPRGCWLERSTKRALARDQVQVGTE